MLLANAERGAFRIPCCQGSTDASHWMTAILDTDRMTYEGCGAVVILLTHHISAIGEYGCGESFGHTLTLADGDHYSEGHVSAAASITHQHLHVPCNIDVCPVLFPHVQEIYLDLGEWG